MKESERLKIEADQTDSDLAYLGRYSKVIRAGRQERFEDIWLKKLKDQTEVVKRENGSYTFLHRKHGIIDFYPKKNRLLIRSKNKWHSNALNFIIKNILK